MSLSRTYPLQGPPGSGGRSGGLRYKGMTVQQTAEWIKQVKAKMKAGTLFGGLKRTSRAIKKFQPIYRKALAEKKAAKQLGMTYQQYQRGIPGAVAPPVIPPKKILGLTYPQAGLLGLGLGALWFVNR